MKIISGTQRVVAIVGKELSADEDSCDSWEIRIIGIEVFACENCLGIVRG